MTRWYTTLEGWTRKDREIKSRVDAWFERAPHVSNEELLEMLCYGMGFVLTGYPLAIYVLSPPAVRSWLPLQMGAASIAFGFAVTAERRARKKRREHADAAESPAENGLDARTRSGPDA